MSESFDLVMALSLSVARRRQKTLSLFVPSLALCPNSPRRGLAHGALEAPKRRTRAKKT